METLHLSVCGCLKLIQFSAVLSHWTFLLEDGGNLLKSFALRLRDTKINKQSEAEKQRSEEDEDVAAHQCLMRKRNTKA